MSLSPGSRLGPYEVVSALGAGGMGEVYRARDRKLHRDVALKVLPEAFASDPERLARLEREARLLASLNHQNIAAIYGLEHGALVLELVEGTTLADRLAIGPIPLDEVLPIARQIADALDAAHERGIVHRDLKPSNIKLRSDGTVKVLDFGLAKGFDSGITSDASQASTIVTPATEMGLILGTAAYMSPEQAQGKSVNKRADIWSFGVVLYEMLTAQRLFGANNFQDTLAAILTREPQWDIVPTEVRRLLKRCLERDPRKRLRDIGEAPFLLDEAASATVVQKPRAGRAVSIRWAVAGLSGALLALALVQSAPWRAAPPRDDDLLRFTVDLGAIDLLGATAAISPDGTRIVYRAQRPGGSSVPLLATRLLNEATETFLPGTEGGFNPFFSPDGQWVAFFTLSELKKVPVAGGVPITLCDAPGGRSGTWGEDGTIVAELSPFSGLWRVSDRGGTPARLTRPSLDRHGWPQFLPGGKAILYSAGPEGLMENGRVEALSLDGGEPRTVLRGGYQSHYIPTGETTGHLVYLHSGVLYAVGFNPGRFMVLGEPVQLVDDVASTGTDFAAALSFSRTGTFAYATGKLDRMWSVAWSDGSGTIQPVALAPGAYYTPRVSPDGDRVVFSVDGDRGQDVYVHDFRRGITSRLTLTGEGNLWPVWAPDGEHLLFTSRSAEGGSLWWTRADGTRQPQPIFKSRNSIRQIAISPDGRNIGYTEQDPDTGSDLWILPIDLSDPDVPKPHEPRAMLKTPRNEGVPAFSPDGRWIAYMTDELGAFDLWVQPFPDLKGRWQLTSGDGGYPYWSRSAPELFWPTIQGIRRVAYIAEGGRFVLSKRSLWGAPMYHFAPVGLESLDLSPDGKRFLILQDAPTNPTPAARVTFLLNFFAELRRRVPVAN